MRELVEPPPSLHCDLCGGELRLKLIAPEELDLDTELFICSKCGHEQSYRVRHDRFSAPHRTSSKS